MLSPSVSFAHDSASSLGTIELNSENLPEIPQNSKKDPEVESETDQSQETTEEDKIEPELSPEELEKYEKFVQADKLYLQGETIAAEKLYRSLKLPFEAELRPQIEDKLAPIHDPAKLDAAGAVYWKMYQQGLENKHLLSKRLISLQLLVEQYPHFIPANIHYAELLESQGQDEKALKVLQQALINYPDDASLLKAKIEEDEEEKTMVTSSYQCPSICYVQC